VYDESWPRPGGLLLRRGSRRMSPLLFITSGYASIPGRSKRSQRRRPGGTDATSFRRATSSSASF